MKNETTPEIFISHTSQHGYALVFQGQPLCNYIPDIATFKTFLSQWLALNKQETPPLWDGDKGEFSPWTD
jgi:hypothetical protein